MVATAEFADCLRWRFSLRGLMLTTAVLMGLVWFFNFSWDADEHIFAGVWMLCVPLTIAIAQRQRHVRLVAPALIGAAVPVSAFWLAHMLHLYGLGYRVEPKMIVTLVTVACAGGIAAALLAAGVRIYRDSKPETQIRLMLTSMILLTVGLAVRTALVVQTERLSWKPLLTVSDYQGTQQFAEGPPFALSNDGSVLAVAIPLANDKVRVHLWDVDSTSERMPLNLSAPYAQSLCFSPDSSQIAVVHGLKGVSIYETKTGRLIKFLDVVAYSPWTTNNCAFSGDGQKLTVIGYDNADREFRVETWATDTWKSLDVHRVLGMVRLFAGEQGPMLLRSDSRYYNCTLVDAETLKPLAQRYFSFGPVGRPNVSRDGNLVWSSCDAEDLRTGEDFRLPGPLYCLVSGRRFVTRRCDMEAYRLNPPDWRLGVPFLRHWWQMYGSASGQAVLIDVKTGEEICASPLYSRESFLYFEASADGNTVAGKAGWGGPIRVWRVPK